MEWDSQRKTLYARLTRMFSQRNLYARLTRMFSQRKTLYARITRDSGPYRGTGVMLV